MYFDCCLATLTPTVVPLTSLSPLIHPGCSLDLSSHATEVLVLDRKHPFSLLRIYQQRPQLLRYSLYLSLFLVCYIRNKGKQYSFLGLSKYTFWQNKLAACRHCDIYFLLLLKEVYVKSLNDLLFLSIQRFFLELSADDMKHFELVSNKSSSKTKRHEETSASHDSHPSFNKDIELCTVLESEERTTGRQMSSVSLALYRKTFLLSNPYN